MFQEANSFPRSKFDETSEPRGTDDDQGQISEHIFTLSGGYCVYYLSNIYRNMKIGKYHSGTRQFYLWIFSHVKRLDQSLVNENVWGIKNTCPICELHIKHTKLWSLMIILSVMVTKRVIKEWKETLEFSLEFIENHSHTHDSSPQIYTRILRSSLFRFKPFYKYKKTRW